MIQIVMVGFLYLLVYLLVCVLSALLFGLHISIFLLLLKEMQTLRKSLNQNLILKNGLIFNIRKLKKKMKKAKQQCGALL